MRKGKRVNFRLCRFEYVRMPDGRMQRMCEIHGLPYACRIPKVKADVSESLSGRRKDQKWRERIRDVEPERSASCREPDGDPLEEDGEESGEDEFAPRSLEVGGKRVVFLRSRGITLAFCLDPDLPLEPVLGRISLGIKREARDLVKPS